MRNFFARFFAPSPARLRAQEEYIRLVVAARAPALYRECAVPDTLDGRFDAIVLHVFLALAKLKKTGGDAAFQRALVEAFIDDMDRSVRELGTTDTGVGKRVKTMTQAFYGRLSAYEAAFPDAAQLKEALKRNLYRGAAVPAPALEQITRYVLKEAA